MIVDEVPSQATGEEKVEPPDWRTSMSYAVMVAPLLLGAVQEI